MLFEMTDAVLSVGEQMILDHTDFFIKGNEKIALVGSNGAGKTTLLQVLMGELSLDGEPGKKGQGIKKSRKLTFGILRQQAVIEADQTVEEYLLSHFNTIDRYDRERFYLEKEFDSMFTAFGLSKSDKKRKISSFSGGEQTKIALIALLLKKPDVLLLDEPTNHLDMHAAIWLEQYLKEYPGAVIAVSHDRYFLDQIAQVVYELDHGKLTRYPGNYRQYKEEKRKRLELQKKAYEKYEQEKKRLEELIERFKNKPNKAAFARAKKSTLNRMQKVEKPVIDTDEMKGIQFQPEVIGNKHVLETDELKIGYDHVLLQVTCRIKRGQKICLIGENGSGKSTFLKTIAGFLEPIKGELFLGDKITIGYFDQLTAKRSEEISLLEQFHKLYPALTHKEIRQILAAFLFKGNDVAKRISVLSGGEKTRYTLAELMQSKPNFLVLDEPTNHMDIKGKERLEEVLKSYEGTMLFTSHDRYFAAEVADALLIIEKGEVYYYPFGYRHYQEHYINRQKQPDQSIRLKAEEQALISGIRSVPKAEKHRLKEIPEEQAYLDWKLRLAKEELEKTKETIESLIKEQEELIFADEYNGTKAREQLHEAWEQWTGVCLAWYEIWEEIDKEKTEALKEHEELLQNSDML